MLPSDRDAIEAALSRIPQEEFRRFLSHEGLDFSSRLDSVRGALAEAGRISRGAPKKPVLEFIDLLGHRLMSDDTVGPWIRGQLIRQLPPTKYRRLVAEYREHAGARADHLHGNMAQRGAGAPTMAAYWHQGSDWALAFCEIVGLPEVLAQRAGRVLPADEEVLPTPELKPLHTFQVDVYKRLLGFMRTGRGGAALLSLPTGAGKTRVAVDAICDMLANGGKRRGVVLWISQSDELQMQAWQCFREVWQASTTAVGDGRSRAPLRLVRLWGGRDLDTITVGDEPTVFIAGIDQLASWTRASETRGSRREKCEEVFRLLRGRRVSTVVIDEAHRLINEESRDVFVKLGLRAARHWRTVNDAPPVIGLTATPWRTRKEELGALLRYFSHNLLRPRELRDAPVSVLVRRGVLSRVDSKRLRVTGREMTPQQWARYSQFGKIPEDYLEVLGADAERNAKILNWLCKLPRKRRTLVFACSIRHAEVLALMLNTALGDGSARVVTSDTSRADRFAAIEQFRRGTVRFLVNVAVLTTGFDAPLVDVVCVARPTMSTIMYEQMVGRGLRGPLNGGTKCCTVLDVQDAALKLDVLSYGRVLEAWEGPKALRPRKAAR